MTPTPNGTGDPAVKRWVWAILAIFTAIGFGFGNWLARLPAVRDHLGASTFEMSFYGLCLAAGSTVGLLLAGRTVAWLGPRRAMTTAALVQAVAMPVASSVIWTGAVPAGLAVLFVFGFALSTCDVAMNVSGAAAERALGRPRLPLFHAGFSLGTVSAMGVGALAEAGSVAVPLHLTGVFAAVLVVLLMALRFVPRNEEDHRTPSAHTASVAIADGSRRPYVPWKDPRVLLIGCVAMAMSLAEGTAADWLPLALVDGRGVANETGALILGVFFVSMTATRLAGSLILARLGRVTVLRGGAILCAIGVIIVILLPASWSIVLGALCWGVGAGLGFPVAISAAADNPRTAVKSVAAVSTIAYTAMLLGPMAFGFLGEHIGLLTAFWLLAAIALMSSLLAGVAREPVADVAERRPDDNGRHDA